MSGLVAIVGPTEVGKSALAVYLAQRFGGEIVNADSRQVYRGMDVGTAKPTAEERSLVPHHLFDLIDPDQPFSLALYQEHAYQAIADIQAQGRLPFLVGGTGQYVWAVLEGWQVPRVPPEAARRRELEARPGPQLYQELLRVDPVAAASIHPHNRRRIIRALEVCYATGQPFSQLKRRMGMPFPTLVIGLTTDRVDLYRRIDARVEAMLAAGWVDEVRALLAQGYSPDLPSFSSNGYGELALYLQGQVGFAAAVEVTRLSTHRVARHQYAWFRLSDPRIRWLDIREPGFEARAEALVLEFLSGPELRLPATAG
ncbi:MAG: tRNA (adenosine(37)-N6)-dimethylallyltransferase MiaA [Chloroflexi bacterium]|nr:tRNA (adenosine(37)-N6)-dimethylallyltransferase MiaA [Chloroflexota bacterium]